MVYNLISELIARRAMADRGGSTGDVPIPKVAVDSGLGLETLAPVGVGTL